MTRNYSQVLAGVNFREPTVLVRGALGLLFFANLLAAVFQAARQRLDNSKKLIGNMELSRGEGDKFLAASMTSRKRTYSTIDTEMNKLAETAGMKVGDLNYTLPDRIEGTADLAVLSITANFEGNYAQLVKFVNLLDRSPRFLLIDTLQVAPQPKGDILSTTVKLDTFIKDDQEAQQ